MVAEHRNAKKPCMDFVNTLYANSQPLSRLKRSNPCLLRVHFQGRFIAFTEKTTNAEDGASGNEENPQVKYQNAHENAEKNATGIRTRTHERLLPH